MLWDQLRVADCLVGLVTAGVVELIVSTMLVNTKRSNAGRRTESGGHHWTVNTAPRRMFQSRACTALDALHAGLLGFGEALLLPIWYGHWSCAIFVVPCLPVLLGVLAVAFTLRVALLPFRATIVYVPAKAPPTKPLAESRVTCFSQNAALTEFNIMNATNALAMTGTRRGPILKYLLRDHEDKDFVCLQEVFDPAAAAFLADGLSYFGYNVVYQCKAARVVGIASGLLLASKRPIAAIHFDSFKDAIFDDSMANKGVLSVTTTDGIFCANTHAQAMVPMPKGKTIAYMDEVRTSQFTTVVQQHRAATAGGAGVFLSLLMGDWNVSTWDEGRFAPFKNVLLKTGGFVDTTPAAIQPGKANYTPNSDISTFIPQDTPFLRELQRRVQDQYNIERALLPTSVRASGPANVWRALEATQCATHGIAVQVVRSVLVRSPQLCCNTEGVLDRVLYSPSDASESEDVQYHIPCGLGGIISDHCGVSAAFDTSFVVVSPAANIK